MNDVLYSVNGGTYNNVLTINFIVIILLCTHEGLKNKNKIIAYMSNNSSYVFRLQTNAKFLCIIIV